MKSLPYPDLMYLEAAKGWYLLGDLKEAEAELSGIRPEYHPHADVLEVKFAIYSKRTAWVECMEICAHLLEAAPDRATSWVNCAFTLHELRQTQQAWNALYSVHERFPKVPTIPYNLACYACQLGQLEDSRHWLRRAFKVGGSEFKTLALNDPDLRPLWDEISRMPTTTVKVAQPAVFLPREG